MTRGAREQMIDAAERLVAERGFAAMSLREVQAAAGQRNKSAAQYHFGSREGLIEAVLVRHMEPVNTRRLALVAAADERPGGAARRDLARAMVVPVAEHTLERPESRWARFVFQGYADPVVGQVVRRHLSGQGYRSVRDRLAAGLDHVPGPLRDRRVDQATGLLFLSLAAAETARDLTGVVDPPAEVQVADLVDAFLAVLEAPVSDETLAALDRSLTATEARP